MRTCILRAFGLRLPWRLSLMLRLFYFASFPFLCFLWSRGPLFSRPSICRRPDSHMFVCVSPLLFIWKYMSLFPSIFCTIAAFSLYGRLSFRMVVFYLVTTSWIFYISLCENSINQSIISLCKKINPMSQGRKTPSGREKRTMYSHLHTKRNGDDITSANQTPGEHTSSRHLWLLVASQ